MSAFGGKAELNPAGYDPRADMGWIEIPQRSSPGLTEIVLPSRSDTPEGRQCTTVPAA